MTTLFISHSSKDKLWAERMHQVLSDSGYQCLFLDSHPDDGIHAGADWERTLYQRLRQSRGVVVLCTANWLASPWCVAEVMMARERKRRVFLLATADVTGGLQVKGSGEAVLQIPDFLKDRQFISLAGVSDESANQILLQGLKREGLKKHDFKLPKRPYPGLKPFQETDAAVFFGRDDENDQVINVLHKCRKGDANGFVLVLGASGCGKSSLMRAGVLPQLKRASKDDGTRSEWVVVPPFLGGKGLEGLALSFAQAFKDAGQPRELGAVRGRLATVSDLRMLGSELLLAHSAPDGCVLLVLDQLEEVFSTPGESEAREALGLLLDTSADASGSIAVLATMRSDFLNAFQLFEGAANRYEEVTLDPMLRSHFSEVIEGPADRFGLDLDSGLTERMVEETAYNDALPLLAFTLEKLYEKCKSQGQLMLKVYDELGGVSAAIKHTADKILKETGYTVLSADDLRRRALRRAFYSLAQVGEESQFTRRTARWSQMPVSCNKVLRQFVKERLLVSSIDAQGQQTLSVAHEALFRVWDTLNGWLLQDRKALALRAQIEDAAADWEGENRAESRAWLEERILDTVRQIEKSGVSLDDVKNQVTANAFLGPTDPQEIAKLPALGSAENAAAGSGRYGEAWRLPLSHEARASAGVRLALLGDTRHGVGLRDGLPDIDWRRIEGSEVTLLIRSNPDDPNSEIIKRLTCPVDSFWMARYPVTVAQFQAFLQDCYREGRWRLPPGCAVNLPDDYPPPRHRARYGNHPADSVDWWSAQAFCYWLSVRLRFRVRLPTEFEWECAATGGDSARIYPWGANWDLFVEPWRANTARSGLGRSTAVGMYPAGASRADILDMVGTIWEWCQNAFDNPDNNDLPQSREDRRVLRGGSWGHDWTVARSNVRLRFVPDLRYFDLGFRVVCSSPSLDTDY